MKYEYILMEKEAGIATLTLNRPDKLNAVHEAMGHEFMEAMETLGHDSEVRVVVVGGAGKAFCSGGDLDGFMALVEARERGEAGVFHPDFRRRVPFILRGMPQPVIASLHGAVMGLGFSIALNCDLRIAAEDTRFGTGHLRLGLSSECGSTYILPRLIGLSRALELTLTGRSWDAREAERIGLVNSVVPNDRLHAATYELARTIAAGPPLSLPIIKRLMHQGLYADLPSQVEAEALAIQGLFQTRDHAEGVRALFQKRPPIFQGR
ncbi:MAG: enoyl-CoA hydratase/isomerase family protein [Chloroflexi bacterium]|nr:enoyl-CoA hydratase/isomerase family protein [Chloroflexota bacterium]